MGKYMIIKKNEYEKMKKNTSHTIDNYTYLLNTTNNAMASMVDMIRKIHEEISNTLQKLNMTEAARKKNASKIGALTTNYNKEKKKTKELINTINELEDTVKLQQLEIEKKDVQNKILKNVGKQKQLDDYKKLQELNQDIQKHKKVK